MLAIYPSPVNDSQSGVNFDSIKAVNADGQSIEPLVFDRSSGIISYKVGSNGIQITALDKAGNEVQRSYMIHKNGMAESLESSDGPLHQIGEGETETILPGGTDQNDAVISDSDETESTTSISERSITDTDKTTTESSSEEESEDGLVLDLQ